MSKRFAMLWSKEMAIHRHPNNEMRNPNRREGEWPRNRARCAIGMLSTFPVHLRREGKVFGL